MTLDLPLYEYTPLSLESEIRILVLEPTADFSDPLEATMIHEDLGTTQERTDDETEPRPLPHYEAVSYVWGEADFTYRLVCDGRLLKITRVVDTLLRYLRSNRKKKRLWIDALCIDQASEADKTHQIPRMGQIFGYAWKVRAWLGGAKEDDGVPLVFDFIRKIGGQERREDHERGSEIVLTPALARMVVQFFMRPWFFRRLVLQERALSRVLIIHCGENKIPCAWVSTALE
ncbi:heterokaryon incompatibility protein-domain-containing protein, partial [Lophiotrema nucula]